MTISSSNHYNCLSEYIWSIGQGQDMRWGKTLSFLEYQFKLLNPKDRSLLSMEKTGH